jgi:ATP-dependent exoDNAse (exonuclease V) beta subunit
MSKAPSDQAARDRFTSDWTENFAVVANAGSGKTTAISERLAAMALAPGTDEMLKWTAVVTYTKKAAAQIGQRARSVLLRRIGESGKQGLEPLARLERVFFGTIHSFCLVLARRHGSTLGVHLKPRVIGEGDDGPWEEFLEQDPMTFSSLGPSQIAAFLRHAALDEIFGLARSLDSETAARIRGHAVAPAPPAPDARVLEEILSAKPARKGTGAAALERNKEAAKEWLRRFAGEAGVLPIAKPEGEAAGIRELYRRFFAPLKQWLADSGGALAAELSLRYGAWRAERGYQTHADQVETALSVLRDPHLLERIREEGWRVILDEAQDTDAKQFSVLVEIVRPPGAAPETWLAGGEAPRPGHFCMVGDAQQGIYSSRADIRNFQDHVTAFEHGNGGTKLTFDVTFRAPRRVVRLLNTTLPAAFGAGREHNLDLHGPDGAPGRLVQVPYEPLVAFGANPEGAAWILSYSAGPVPGSRKVSDQRLANEARKIAALLVLGGPAAVGAKSLGDICVLAPRRGWLQVVREQFEAAGLKTALQLRRNRNGDNPVYAWLSGLLAVVCDPDNTFEWVGVLREIFAVSDAAIAERLRREGGLGWEEPGDCAEPLRSAFAVMRSFIDRADSDGESLERFATELAQACDLAGKARLVDPDGGLEDELGRLLARAADLGISGAGPRAWLGELMECLEDLRAAGRPAPDAINLITSQSAKGLEWPVVIPVGLWRSLSWPDSGGLRVIPERGGQFRLVLDNDGVGAARRLAGDRELLRESVRLLYVTLTRAKGALVIPWCAGSPQEDDSFGDLWGMDPGALDPLPEPARPSVPPEAADASAGINGFSSAWSALPMAPRAPALPARVLPHALARSPDMARAARHESALDGAFPVGDGADPLDYGVWWHETLEFLPWNGSGDEVAAHGAASLERAAQLGFGQRAGEEWDRLLASEPWRLMRDPRWTRLAEVGVFAPLGPHRWIDGVIDLVLRDESADELWIVDWKTNRRTAQEDDRALLLRLSADYEGQLSAYGSCASGFFGGANVALWVYSTVAGNWIRAGGRP